MTPFASFFTASFLWLRGDLCSTPREHWKHESPLRFASARASWSLTKQQNAVRVSSGALLLGSRPVKGMQTIRPFLYLFCTFFVRCSGDLSTVAILYERGYSTLLLWNQARAAVFTSDGRMAVWLEAVMTLEACLSNLSWIGEPRWIWLAVPSFGEKGEEH